MRSFAYVLLGLLLGTGFNMTIAGEIEIAIKPAAIALEQSDATVTMSDGSRKTIKGPSASLQLQITNGSSEDTYKVATVVFFMDAGLDAERERYSFSLSKPLEIAPGESITTDTFYLDNLPASNGSQRYVSTSVTGWKNTGADPGDEFAAGAGFNLP